MSTSLKRILAILAALAVCGFTFVSTASAQDEPEAAPEEAAPADDAAPADEAKLTEEQLDYVAISGTVACYNKRVEDGKKAAAAAEAFLESEGLTLDEYKAMEKKFRGDSDVQTAIKDEMSMCDTKVLAMPEEDAPAAEALSDEEKKAMEEAEKKNEWTYSSKVYKSSSISSSGVRGGRLVFSFQKNGKNASGNFGGKHDGQSFSVGFKGVRKAGKNALTLSGSSGKTNSAKVSIDFKKKTKKVTKDGVETEYDWYLAKGKYSGKINGKNVSFSFEAEPNKKK